MTYQPPNFSISVQHRLKSQSTTHQPTNHERTTHLEKKPIPLDHVRLVSTVATPSGVGRRRARGGILVMAHHKNLANYSNQSSHNPGKGSAHQKHA